MTRRHPLHDYSSGAGCFITFSTHNRKPLLARLRNTHLELLPAGLILEECWMAIPDKFPNTHIDCHQIMPDHFHGILIVAAIEHIAELPNLGEILKWLKGNSSHKINQVFEDADSSFWQAGYYEWIIRSEAELEKFRYYIHTNPERLVMKQKAQAASRD